MSISLNHGFCRYFPQIFYWSSPRDIHTVDVAKERRRKEIAFGLEKGHIYHFQLAAFKIVHGGHYILGPRSQEVTAGKSKKWKWSCYLVWRDDKMIIRVSYKTEVSYNVYNGSYGLKQKWATHRSAPWSNRKFLNENASQNPDPIETPNWKRKMQEMFWKCD